MNSYGSSLQFILSVCSSSSSCFCLTCSFICFVCSTKSVLEIRKLLEFLKPLSLFNWFLFDILQKTLVASLIERMSKMSDFFHISLKILRDKIIM